VVGGYVHPILHKNTSVPRRISNTKRSLNTSSYQTQVKLPGALKT